MLRHWIALGLAVGACTAVTSAPVAPAAGPTESAPEVADATVVALPSATPAASSAAPDDAGVNATDGEVPRASDPDAGTTGPSACPLGMQLVEGEYCTDIEQKCLRSWFDKSNKKTVCEDFDPAGTRCVGAKVKKRYCIDRYEWPNQAGVRPEVMNIFYQAEVKCAAVGKRLCTESEWTMACEGPELKPFPYGYVRDPDKCNGDREWDGPNMKKVAQRDAHELARLWQGVPSGSQPECVSDYGVSDLPGNADEVTASEHYDKGDFTGKYDSVHTGGPWYKGVRNQCRPKIYTHDEGFYYYFLSFRCCAEPDGLATDPRTPRQQKEGWKFEKVERLARFSTAQMQQKLAEKQRGSCTCRDKDKLCRTMCGTLLGPEAKDAPRRK